MRRVTPESILAAINALPRNQCYRYVNPNNHGLIKLVGIDFPNGPISIKRWDPTRGETEKSSKIENISYNMILRLANAFQEEEPINVERILGASYNTRSVLEALLVHTPEFYFSYPGRIEIDNGTERIKKGHKHIIWLPDSPHQNGLMAKPYKYDGCISEIPPRQVAYSELHIENVHHVANFDDATLRRHTQMQIAAYYIGLHLNYHTWIAQNDYKIKYHGKPLNTYNNMIKSLSDCNIIKSFPEAVEAGKLIDCIWITGHQIPAVMEVEHSTGITSGLDRMLNFKNSAPRYENTRYVIIAPDEDRHKVKGKSSKKAFECLDVQFFPYSAVEELYDLCRRRNIRGIGPEFLDCFMEPMLS